jgi:glycosyltransferase involved in cell wall biosynthesis
MVFIEAIACGCVVVTSDIAPMTEFLTHGKNGITVKEFEDPARIAEALRQGCCDTALRSRVKKDAAGSIVCFEKNVIERIEARYYQLILDGRTHG